MDDRDIFSYDNSNNEINSESQSFDLNSFSTKAQNIESISSKKTPPKKVKNTKQKEY